MSVLRRWKSFSSKKYSSTGELKASEQDAPRARIRGRGLVRERSISMETVPLRFALESNELYLRQKKKQELTPPRTPQTPQPPPRRNQPNRAQLKKRKSQSFDETRFAACIEEIQLRGAQGRPGHRSRYNTVDVMKVSFSLIRGRKTRTSRFPCTENLKGKKFRVANNMCT
jgi:hypothetical protein